MKVKIQQFLFGKNHSWSIVGKSIGRELLKIGHDVDFVSTDGVKDQFVPDCIRPHIRPAPVGTYDLQLSYTAMKNFQPYLTNGSKNRFGIYNYDGSVLPPHWAKCYNHTDKILPSSEYAKQVFIDAKVPESHLIVVPHGIDIGDFDIPEEKIYKLKTKKTVKILNVCGQVHRRKNLAGILEAYGKAFTKDDDVCLVLKVADKPPTTQFEISFRELYEKWKKKNPAGPEVEVIYQYIDDIESLFLACDIHFSLSNIECFHIPSLQSMAANMITIQSNFGGNLDFMSEKNSYLVNGEKGRCPPNYQYWTPSRYAEMFIPNVDDAVDKLRYVVENLDKVKKDFEPHMKETVEQFTWGNVAKQILDLTE